MKKTILTGDRPTGELHLGHYVGSLQNRVKMQYEYNQFIIIADTQTLTDNPNRKTELRKNILSIVKDYLAVGIDPHLNTIFIQSQIPELSELTMYFMNLVNLNRLLRNPTIKEEMKFKKFGVTVNRKTTSTPVGFINYPISQAADILTFHASVIPVGVDQIPILEQTNEIALAFNRVYEVNYFSKTEGLLSNTPKLVGTDGGVKMGKSLNNTINLSDDFNTIKKKVQSMYTNPNHLRVNDPGNVEGNVVFKFLDIFDNDKIKVQELKNHYTRGGLGDGVLKERLTHILENIISPIREKRKLYNDDVELLNIVKKGSVVARNTVYKTISEVREIIGLKYY